MAEAYTWLGCCCQFIGSAHSFLTYFQITLVVFGTFMVFLLCPFLCIFLEPVTPVNWLLLPSNIFKDKIYKLLKNYTTHKDKQRKEAKINEIPKIYRPIDEAKQIKCRIFGKHPSNTLPIFSLSITLPCLSRIILAPFIESFTPSIFILLDNDYPSLKKDNDCKCHGS